MDGAKNAKSELLGTIKELLSPDTKNGHAICDFPARKNWLQNQLDMPNNVFPVVECKDYEIWRNNVRSISLVFADGYLENPASLYGHLLLKFNSESQQSFLLDKSVNFGAKVPDDENPLRYILKGISGLYSSKFSTAEFYKNTRIYKELEQRDLWEYKLNLTEQEVSIVQDHTWELLNKADFDYFFFKENCAYRIAELLEIVIDKPLNNKSLPWALPIDIVNRLHDGNGFLTSLKYHPSRETLFLEKYKLLNNSQKIIVDDFIEVQDVLLLNSENLSNGDKSKIYDTLFSYYSFLYAKNLEDLKYKSINRSILKAQLKLPEIKIPKIQHKKIPPHIGQKTTLSQFRLVHNKKIGDGIVLRVRPVYYDKLSLGVGRLPYSTVSMFDLNVAYFNRRFRLHSLDLVNIETLNPNRKHIPNLHPYAWKVRLGVEQMHNNCFPCKTIFSEMGVGKSYLNSMGLFYFMIEGRVESNTGSQFSVTPKFGSIIKLSSAWVSILDIGNKHYLNANDKDIMVFQWNNRFGYSRDWDIQFSVSSEKAIESRLSVGLYW